MRNYLKALFCSSKLPFWTILLKSCVWDVFSEKVHVLPNPSPFPSIMRHRLGSVWVSWIFGKLNTTSWNERILFAFGKLNTKYKNIGIFVIFGKLNTGWNVGNLFAFGKPHTESKDIGIFVLFGKLNIETLEFSARSLTLRFTGHKTDGKGNEIGQSSGFQRSVKLVYWAAILTWIYLAQILLASLCSNFT